MKEIIVDTLLDCLKLLPFLFVAFLIMEFLEHKMKNYNQKVIEKAGRMGPLLGSLLGVFPQCGFSVVAANFYATRIITLGTLIAIYLSTSDEMLPILLSEKANISTIIGFILIKLVIGMIFGFLIDLVVHKKESEHYEIHEFCHEEHCDCEHGILKSTAKHTIHILLFIMVITFLLNLGFSYLGEETISKLFMKNSIFGPFITSLLGLIPNCGSSVIITELYLNDTISFASTIAGLLTGSGVGLLVLFKMNKDLKENIVIMTTLYAIGVFIGLLFQVVGIKI